MILIGLTGPIGHGKSTTAEMFRGLVKRSGHADSGVIAEIANQWLAQLPDNLKAGEPNRNEVNAWIELLVPIFKDSFGIEIDLAKIVLSPDQFEPNHPDSAKLLLYLEQRQSGTVKDEVIIEENKGPHRAILQWLGGYLVKHVDEGIWYEEIERRFHKAEKEGCELFTVAGIRFPFDANVIHRNGGYLIKIVRDHLIDPDVTDVTEQERDKIRVDTVLHNNGDLAALGATVDTILTDLKAGQLKNEYVSQ